MHLSVPHHTTPTSSTTDFILQSYPTYTMKHSHFYKHLHTPREFMEQLSYNWKVFYSAFIKMKQQQKREYDLHRQFQTLRFGDLVLVKIAAPRLQSLGGTPAAHTSGPYRITAEIVPNTTYQVYIPDRIFSGNKSFHISKLLPCHGMVQHLDLQISQHQHLLLYYHNNHKTHYTFHHNNYLTIKQ